MSRLPGSTSPAQALACRVAQQPNVRDRSEPGAGHAFCTALRYPMVRMHMADAAGYVEITW
jgi:hypothetical protein